MESCACVLTVIEKKIGIMWVCFEHYRAKKLESFVCVLTMIEQKNEIVRVCFDHYRTKNWNHEGVF